jgi:hypothetical protein
MNSKQKTQRNNTKQLATKSFKEKISNAAYYVIGIMKQRSYGIK